MGNTAFQLEAEDVAGYDPAPVFNARWKAALKSCDKTEHLRREAFADEANKREKKRLAVFYPSGSLIRVSKMPGWEPYEKGARGKRGKIRGFTGKSRLAFLTTVAMLDRSAEVPKMVTLTYPSEYPEQFQNWKEDLHFFAIYLGRKYENAAFLWKLEPQKRGAPHFHLLMWGVPFLDREWLSQAWYEIVGSGDERHLRAGTRVEYVRTWDGVMNYAGKNYLGKECVAPRNWPEFAGRYWGAYGRKKLPWAKAEKVEMSYEGLVRIHRFHRRLLASRGVKWKTGGGLRIFTTDFKMWLRAFEWAEEHWTHPIDHSIAATLQPF